jgi:hypothetical protein
MLLNAGIRMLVVCAALWVVIRLSRLRNPHAEILVWRMTLLASLALPALMFFRVAPTFATHWQLPVLSAERAGMREATALGILPGMSWRVFFTIYLGVTLLLLARLAVGLVALWRICRAAERLPVGHDVRVSRDVRTPATFGSVVLLPVESSTWPAAKRDAVLAHELAHVRTRDSYWSWLAQLHAALFWFGPHAWWLRLRLASLAETTSDDAVVAARHNPVSYAALLLDFARNPHSRSVAMSIAESNVSRRIERLLSHTPPAGEVPRIARWAAFALLVPAVMFAASTTRAAAPAAAAITTLPSRSTSASPVRWSSKSTSMTSVSWWMRVS